MWPVSAKFVAALQQSNDAVFQAVLYQGGAPTGTLLPMSSGSVTVDSTAQFRRTYSTTLVNVDGSLLPSDTNNTILPYGNEVLISRGIAYNDGTAPELVPLGVFHFSDTDVQDDAGAADFPITGFDRSRKVSVQSFDVPYIVAAGQNYITAIVTLVNSRLPFVTGYLGPATDQVTPLLVFDENTDPWAAVQQMASSIGCDVYFDQVGNLVITPTLDPTTLSPAWTFTDQPTTTLYTSRTITSVNKHFTDQDGFNGVVLVGEAATNTPPVRSTIWDTNPQSPTYYLGTYGKRPKFVTSSFAATQQQADAAALREFNTGMGITEELSISTVPNPALDGGDCIRVIRATDGVNDTVIAKQITIPIDVTSAMTLASTRVRNANPSQ